MTAPSTLSTSPRSRVQVTSTPSTAANYCPFFSLALFISSLERFSYFILNLNAILLYIVHRQRLQDSSWRREGIPFFSNSFPLIPILLFSSFLFFTPSLILFVNCRVGWLQREERPQRQGPVLRCHCSPLSGTACELTYFHPSRDPFTLSLHSKLKSPTPTLVCDSKTKVTFFKLENAVVLLFFFTS